MQVKFNSLTFLFLPILVFFVTVDYAFAQNCDSEKHLVSAQAGPFSANSVISDLVDAAITYALWGNNTEIFALIEQLLQQLIEQQQSEIDAHKCAAGCEKKIDEGGTKLVFFAEEPEIDFNCTGKFELPITVFAKHVSCSLAKLKLAGELMTKLTEAGEEICQKQKGNTCHLTALSIDPFPWVEEQLKEDWDYTESEEILCEVSVTVPVSLSCGESEISSGMQLEILDYKYVWCEGIEPSGPTTGTPQAGAPQAPPRTPAPTMAPVTGVGICNDGHISSDEPCEPGVMNKCPVVVCEFGEQVKTVQPNCTEQCTCAEVDCLNLISSDTHVSLHHSDS